MAGKKHILVAEDERPMAMALKAKLTGAGFDVSVVHDGQAAIDTIDKGSFDLLLLDLMMPVKDGFSVLEHIQKKKIKVKTIVSSNLSQNEDELKAKKLGAVDYLVKSDTPITEVVLRIQKALE